MVTREKVITALKGEMVLELSVRGRVTGRLSSRPVWFALLKDRSIFVAPVDGKKSQWYLNVVKNPNVMIRVGRHSFAGKAEEVSSQRLNEVFDLFAAKYGKEDIERYFPSREVALEIPLAASL